MISLYACRTCHAVDNVQVCGRCQRAFYCKDKTCQRLDWAQHKCFCHSEDTPELASRRRHKCLAIIQSFPDLINGALFKEKCLQQPGFVLIREKRSPLFVGVTSIRTLDRLIELPDRRVLKELVYEIGRAHLGHAVSVLYSSGGGVGCYLISAQGAVELKLAIRKMPTPLVEEIFRQYVKIMTADFSVEDLEKVQVLMHQEESVCRKLVEKEEFYNEFLALTGTSISDGPGLDVEDEDA